VGPRETEAPPVQAAPSAPRASNSSQEPLGIQCVAWRQTGGCTPDGPREPENDLPCDAKIPYGASGYCEVLDSRNLSRGEGPQYRRVMSMNCSSHPYEPIMHGEITCGQAAEFAGFAAESLRYRPRGGPRRAQPPAAGHPTQGILICVSDKTMVAAYAAVRLLRHHGCRLPIQLWYLPDELTGSPAIVRELVFNHSVVLKPVGLKRSALCHDGQEKCFNIKIHAVYYTELDQVLLLDSDNFPLRDPGYLFRSEPFLETGAVFWPDFWRRGNTIFNLDETSLVWELTGTAFVDMFEQESGQLLVDRGRHAAALDVLMFYARPNNILYRFGVVYGDKDLFRLAWLRAGRPFHMIAAPPGWAGQMKVAGFCGLTMVQHDPDGRILFLHRNGQKLDATEASLLHVWDAVVEYAGPDPGRYHAHIRVPDPKDNFINPVCYGPQNEEPGYRRQAGRAMEPVYQLEEAVLRYARRAAALRRAL